MKKTKKQAFNFGEAAQIAAGALGARFVSKMAAKQPKIAKFADLVPIAAGFGVAYFAPKYAGVGYGMMAAGAVNLAASKIPALNGSRVIAYPETVSGEEINAMAKRLPAGLMLSNKLKNRLQLPAQAARPAQAEFAPGIISKHYGAEYASECFDGF